MGIDGIFLHFMKEEISSFAIGARVDKISLPAKNELVLVLRTRTETRRLFISVGGNMPRISFTAYAPENPRDPPMLCMLLRKQLASGVLANVRQEGLDRLLYLDFDVTNEIGDRVKRTLAVEVTGQYSNCILLDENNVIIEAFKRVDASKSSFREILPGRPYVLPPQQNKTDLRFSGIGELTEKIISTPGKLLSGALMTNVAGLSPLMAREIAYRASLGDPETEKISPLVADGIKKELCQLYDDMREGRASPCIVKDRDGNYLDFSYSPLTSLTDRGALYSAPDLSSLLDEFCFEKERKARAKAKAEDLFKTVDNLIERASRKINVRTAELEKTGDMEKLRVYAELINANLYRLDKGKTEYRLENYYNGNEITVIPVRPDLSPAANAQRYYKEYNKAHNAKKVLSEQLELAKQELRYLETVRFELSDSSTETQLAHIRIELSGQGYLKSKTGSGNKKVSKLPVRKYTSPGGFTVLVGSNNTQNDELTFKTAKKSDIWFHSQKAPGSHVILSLGGEKPGEADMEFAARVAAFYSSVRSRGNVEVDYTEVRNLKKPPASKPGYVIYHVYNTVYSRVPSEKELKERECR